MILIRNITLQPEEPLTLLSKRAAGKLRLSEKNLVECRLVKRSLDARRKDRIRFVCSVAVSLKGIDEMGESDLLNRLRSADLALWTPPRYEIPDCHEKAPDSPRPVIVGFGPAGMFAALVLSYAALRPIVLERGQDVETRLKAVSVFHAGGPLDPENNVQFGEGGAGTFSDGKLNTGTHDRRISWVLEQFYRHGAPENVLYDAKPHIGTDILTDVVRQIRMDILAHGGDVRFGCRMTALELEDGSVQGVEYTDHSGITVLPCSQLILAIGHSARDTVRTLHAQRVPMERKPFAMGVRIEHRQEMIDRAQYGNTRGNLPPADYSLHVHLPNGKSAFTFCMCPGGSVFAAASEEGGVVTNGMSYSARDGKNANAALLVGLRPEDFPGTGVLAGMEWQREIEQAAYRCGGGNYLAPAQLVGDFLAKRESTGPAEIQPSYQPGVVWTELHTLLPEQITTVLEKAIPELAKKLSGFDDPSAVLTAPETRSSSPVRIVRSEALESPIRGLFPCGEGAGYAGGITSAAVDGMRCAEAVISSII
ncbi:MAG: hypothetical protein IJQ02_06800 [Oscillospiraceae bacterium]|nr:hypothetical protein [Oscillospiraceae bacterium]